MSDMQVTAYSVLMFGPAVVSGIALGLQFLQNNPGLKFPRWDILNPIHSLGAFCFYTGALIFESRVMLNINITPGEHFVYAVLTTLSGFTTVGASGVFTVVFLLLVDDFVKWRCKKITAE